MNSLVTVNRPCAFEKLKYEVLMKKDFIVNQGTKLFVCPVKFNLVIIRMNFVHCIYSL